MQPSRTLSQQVFSRTSNFCAVRFATSIRRVHLVRNGDKSNAFPRKPAIPTFSSLQCRSYATATVTTALKTPGKPKAHTGRTTTTKKRASTTREKPTAKKAKSASKPNAKISAKARPKPRPRKRAVTEKQKEARAKSAASQKLKNLRATALLNAPKGLPSTVWQVLQAEQSRDKTHVSIGAAAKEASSIYKSLSPEERERLNHIANENKTKNDTAHRQWLSSFSAKQIKEANNARLALKRQSKSTGGHKRYQRLHDDRLVKPPMSAYTYFFVERNASGDLNGMKIAEIGGLVGKEWKALSASGKKTYEDMAEADKRRYVLEYKTAYGEDAPVTKAKAATAA